MKNSNLKWTSMVVAIMLFTMVIGCNSGNEGQNDAQEAENMEMSEGMKGTKMENMDGVKTSQQGNAVATVDLDGEPAYIQDYIKIKNALLNDNLQQVKESASNLKKNLKDIELPKEQREQLTTSVSKLAEANDIEVQREHFSSLSRQLYQVVQNKDVTDKKMYWQHCPMAMNGKGANWLSFEEKVQNPYMGQKMPTCGSVEETIN